MLCHSSEYGCFNVPSLFCLLGLLLYFSFSVSTQKRGLAWRAGECSEDDGLDKLSKNNVLKLTLVDWYRVPGRVVDDHAWNLALGAGGALCG